jgi:hypothetical protein
LGPGVRARQGREGLLFWKKEAKNFCSFGAWVVSAAQAKISQSFFVSFFAKKEGLSVLWRLTQTPRSG